MSYELRFSDSEFLYCWNCGEAVEEAKMIHWQRSYHKEILCDSCIQQLVDNEKAFVVIATIKPMIV